MSQHEPSTRSRFTANEYLTVRVDRSLELLHRDAYGNFGWVVHERGSIAPGAPQVHLTLSRERRIKNRPAVVELQHRCETALAAITRMERGVTAAAMTVAIVAGIVGSAFLAGSVVALDAGLVWLSIPLGVLGLLGWAAGYACFGRVRARKAAEVARQIGDLYDVVYETGEEASQLLA
ncbi:hypothetical protein [Cellulomonas sp. KRMCY2]|uniref:hypothetical protein n=1 Tax=Cellulomonas sp. KRMCY2 TaxID=1304865 RepID=UPI00045EA84E|nr:hypothetical protein [Cellulomonas sp. KRMCY2]